MCGISGAVGPAAGGAATVEAQLRSQHHRGPDARGWFAHNGGVIAQNRLAIIDLKDGDPPISNETGSIGAVLNGEIYNFLDLRAQLQAKGHAFASRGDTEVLVHLAETQAAPEIARHLDGMFAFAIWDREHERLVLGRDRTGKKPLHYWYGQGTLVFASEIKGVLEHPCVHRDLDEEALAAYLTFGYVPTPRTFFRGIMSLPPGHTLTLQGGSDPMIEPYWSLAVPGVGGAPRPQRLGMEEAAGQVRAGLRAAVERRLISDVPLGAFLSGGIDSSAVVALMATMSDRPVRTFTIGFDDRDGFDERPFARTIATRFGTEHHEEVVRPEAVDLVERLVWHHDQPFGDSSAIPTFLLAEVTRRDVTVALSGDGGDELFAGYERFAAGLAITRSQRLPQGLLQPVARTHRWVPGAGSGRTAKLRRFVSVLGQGMPQAYLDWVAYVPEELRTQLLPNASNWARQEYADLWRASVGAHPLDRLLALNLRTYLLDDLLVKVDRMSMAHGLEVRSPFLDTGLLELAFHLSPKLKLRGVSLKRVLKMALRDLLPPEILNRPKRGFGVPLDRWFREDLETYATSMLGCTARVRAHLNGAALDCLLAEHHGQARNHGNALWTLLTLELFLRREGW